MKGVSIMPADMATMIWEETRWSRYMPVHSIQKRHWFVRRLPVERTPLHLPLQANLRPGDELLSPVGKPYDTLEEVIGIRPSKGSLAEYGITYRQVDLLEDGIF